jgi:quinol-cytochrome oxidoreductase complex cytochrome b subunit
MSNVQKFLGIVAVAALAVPEIAGAQFNVGGGNLKNVFDEVMTLLNIYAVPFLIAVAVLYFLWGVLQFIINADDEEARKKARNSIVAGLIGLVIMLSFWALVAFIQRSFNLENKNGRPPLPQVTFPTSKP